MRGFGSHAVAFALSMFVAGTIQQFAMVEILAAHQPLPALIPLAVIVLLVSLVLGLVAALAKSGSALNLASACLGGLFFLVGAAALIFGAVDSSPGIGGNILWGLAVLLDVGFLLPGAVAIVIHWWLLRPSWASQAGR
jgi:hypothetical protein